MSELPLSEVFGPVWQGEGPYAGQRTGFVRLGLCNLTCEWCDTPYTWDRSRFDLKVQAPSTSVEKIHDQLRPMDVDVVCLSGGEPLMHRAKLGELLTGEWRWHAETNGTIPPPDWWGDRVEHTSVSPKINTRDPLSKRIKLGALHQWNALAQQGRACFKFVAEDPGELDLVADVVDMVGIRRSSVWVMPLGIHAEELLTNHRALAEGIEDRGWNTTSRLHILLYGEERRR